MSAHRRLHNPAYLQLHITGNGHVQDCSGHGNVCTGSNVAYAAGAYGHDVGSFNGSSAYVATTDATALGPSALTVMAHVRFTASIAATGFKCIGSRWNGVTSRGWILYGSSSKMNLYVNNGATAIASATSFDDQAWHHVAATISGTSANLYVDGANQASVTLAAAYLDATIQVVTGARNNNTANGITDYAPASIGHFRLYNAVLTQDEVIAAMMLDKR